MITISTMRNLACITILSILCACGGSGGGIGGIDGSGNRVTSGPIDGFGSVIVNGVRYDTDNAKIYHGETEVDEATLNVGDYVTVVASLDDDGFYSIAESVHYQPGVAGPISSIATEQNIVTVLGQDIVLNYDTTFDRSISPRDITGLSIGDFIEVSGPRDSLDRIIATRVDPIAADQIKLYGLVLDLSRSEEAFTLNGIRIHYKNAEIRGSIQERSNVRVQVKSFVDNSIVAQAVTVLPNFNDLSQLQEVEHIGYITEYASPESFKIGDIQVRTFDTTEIIDNGNLGLGLDRKVRLIGYFDSLEVLNVNRMEIVPESALKLLGAITNISVPVERPANLLGYIMVQDVLAEVRTTTRLDGQEASENDRLYFQDLSVGDFVIVTGREENNLFIATAVEYETQDVTESTQRLIGFPFEIDANMRSFSMYDIPVQWDETTLFGVDGSASSDEIIQPGMNLEVIGTYFGSTLMASQIRWYTPSFKE